MNEYRFYLFHKDVGAWTRVHDPIGWDGLGRTIKRYGVDSPIGLKWHGIFFDYTAKLKWVKDGKAFIQARYEAHGIETEILMRILKRDKATRKFEIEFEGRIDLSTYKASTIAVECAINNRSFLEKLKNNIDTKVDINSLFSLKEFKGIPAYGSQNITLHSQEIKRTWQGTTALDDDIQANVPAGQYLQFGWDNVKDEIKESFQYFTATNASQPLELFRMAEGGSLDLSATVRLKAFDLGSGFKVQFRLNDQAPVNFSVVIGPPDGTGFETHTFTLDTLVNVSAGDEVRIYGKNDELSAELVTMGNSDVTFTLLSTIPASNAKVMLAHEVFSRVVAIITDGGGFFSDFLGRTDSAPLTYTADGAGSLIALTNGLQIRGIDKPINISFSDLVDTFYALYNIGIGIERVNGIDRVRIEPMAFFFQPKRMMRLDFVKDVEKEVADDLYFNEVQNGPTKWENDEAGNLDEFNTKRSWITDISNKKNLLDLRIPYITSGYTIEFVRREKVEPTKDNQYDNDIFIIQLRRNGGGFEPDKAQDFSEVNNVAAATTAYNLKLSPARTLMNHMSALRIGKRNLFGKTVRFTSGDGNFLASTKLSGEAAPVSEAGVFILSLFPPPPFVSEIYRFRAKLTTAQLKTLAVTDMAAEENVFQYIEFSAKDGDYKRGYLLEARPASDSNEVNFSLLKASI